ncbi:hypothetical protein PHJA_001621000 [Phtheirospermum japonicum]|uniref:Uncharacterized protein n=1 Tax=Phtheirospermum japonicum TaxID=374723 RepID=A0A830C6L0_9LAMI|nr:hypothetical protein PHJA_001621000 [Phtheirospermum japonicum]
MASPQKPVGLTVRDQKAKLAIKRPEIWNPKPVRLRGLTGQPARFGAPLLNLSDPRVDYSLALSVSLLTLFHQVLGSNSIDRIDF